MRPGLILWVIIDLAFVAKQWNDLGRITDSILLTVAFHSWYVLDAEWNEVGLALNLGVRGRSLISSSPKPAILTTMVRRDFQNALFPFR